jgi:hypothetical protein
MRMKKVLSIVTLVLFLVGVSSTPVWSQTDSLKSKTEVKKDSSSKEKSKKGQKEQAKKIKKTKKKATK